jgi:hypothetical protein
MLRSDLIREVFTRFVAPSFAPLANAARQSLALPLWGKHSLRAVMALRAGSLLAGISRNGDFQIAVGGLASGSGEPTARRETAVP